MTLVSVYLITQNRSRLLKRAIESVFKQDYLAIELIVVDDASTDDTSEIVEALQQQYSFIYLKNETISGACFSRNRAITTASGYYITGLDDDDYFYSNRVSQLVSAYDEKYAFVCANVQELMNSGELIDRNFGYQSGEFGLDKMLNYNLVGNQVLTTKAKFEEIGGFDVNMPAFQDYDTWIRLLRYHPLALKISARNYVLDTDHGGVRISSSNKKKLKGYNMFIDKNLDILSKQQLKSMQVMKCKISGKRFGLLDFFAYIHKNNYKSVINLYLVRNMPWIRAEYR
ncbi:glycosyltransferase [Shewanella sp. VB17]|uniref:glycosyltransferase n=1 Tax=Shewanella sp. VB17 TaxID=2739432 RepID=UPI00156535B1|nr:glycosyltransferase [Shewanella sp. VB17]NRD74695.1 glycosyltransferase [Shewanella sp. VB17]